MREAVRGPRREYARGASQGSADFIWYGHGYFWEVESEGLVLEPTAHIGRQRLNQGLRFPRLVHEKQFTPVRWQAGCSGFEHAVV